MCRRTPLSWKESFEQGTVPVPQSAGRVRGGGYNALPEGSLCRIRPGQPGSSANLTPTKRGSALRRRSRQDSSLRVIKFQHSLVRVGTLSWLFTDRLTIQIGLFQVPTGCVLIGLGQS